MLKKLITTFCLALTLPVGASDRTKMDENFMLVLREVEGANKEAFGLVPTGPSTGVLDSGEKVTIHSAWFDLVGDMHVRFVIDGEHTMSNLTMQEFTALDVTPEQAVELAVANLKRRYGALRATEWEQGVMMVAGQSPDLDSSYFMDKSFWDFLLQTHPEGVVVGVPKRGGLLYAPVADQTAVESLEENIHALHASSENLRVSSALYLYKGGQWSVHRKAAPTKP